MAIYSEETIGVVELKLGELTQKHLTQLEDYLEQREQILNEYAEMFESPKWIGVLVGSSIDRELESKILEGHRVCENIPIAALTVTRYRDSDGQLYVVTDTYFNKGASRDYTKYRFDGREYGKGRLVLAVISKFVEDHPDITYSRLEKIFPKKVQGSWGVFTTKAEAEEIYARTSRKRYFIEPDELIQLKDAVIAVCTQWGARKIDSFISEAKQHGYKIKST